MHPTTPPRSTAPVGKLVRGRRLLRDDLPELDAAGFSSAGLGLDDVEAASDIRMSSDPSSAGRLAYGGWISFHNYRGRR